jgi:hypothetical protein
MGGIAYRLILLAGGSGLFMLGLFYFGFYIMKPGEPYGTTDRLVELLGCFFAMLIGLMVVWGGILGSLEAGIAMWIPTRNGSGGGTSSSNGARTNSSNEVGNMDEYEAKRRGGQKCPDCGSYDTYYVETVGVDTAQFKCNRCGSYFLKDR